MRKKRLQTQHFFVTADDRTGALEVGGVVANEQFSVPVGPHAEGPCCVVDIATRHVEPIAAQQRITKAHGRDAAYRCHKMDSGLRGNWPYEARALADLGHCVAVVASYPDAGRRCKNGQVLIHDVPVTQSAFGQDPFGAPESDYPVEILEARGCAARDIEVWDANDNDELADAIDRCHAEGRVLVGPTGAIAKYASRVYPSREPATVGLPSPVLIVCGSLSAVSREQIAELDVPRFGVGDRLKLDEIAVLTTHDPGRRVSIGEANEMARALADRVYADFPRGTLIVVGGDTAAAIIGEETLDVMGTVGTAIPASRYRDWVLVTKGGSIGTKSTLLDLLENRR